MVYFTPPHAISRHIFQTFTVFLNNIFSHIEGKVKRYKQTILSNFFMTQDGPKPNHLVEANLDIESRSDITLCTEILKGVHGFHVLTNDLLASVCPICTAILIRRINNMPQDSKPVTVTNQKSVESKAQLSLYLSDESGKREENRKEKTFKQFELVL